MNCLWEYTLFIITYIIKDYQIYRYVLYALLSTLCVKYIYIIIRTYVILTNWVTGPKNCRKFFFFFFKRLLCSRQDYFKIVLGESILLILRTLWYNIIVLRGRYVTLFLKPFTIIWWDRWKIGFVVFVVFNANIANIEVHITKPLQHTVCILALKENRSLTFFTFYLKLMFEPVRS